MLPFFPFAEWELPPELDCERAKPADARVFAKFQSVRQDVLLRSVRVGGSVLLFARAEWDEDGEENDDDANWVCAQSESEWAFPAFWPLITPREEWHQNLWNSEWGRAFFLENSLAFLLADGRGSWLPLDENIKGEAPFFWGDGATNWAKRPASEWLERLKIELRNPDSDARFSRDFLGWDEQKRGDFLVKCRRGSVAGLRALLPQILLCDPDLLDKNDLGVNLNLSEDFLVESLLFSSDSDGAKNGIFDLPLTPFFRAWEARIETHFKPRLNRKIYNSHTAIRHFSSGGLVMISVFIQAISAHERIEAHHNLRAWARQHNIPFSQI